jgi:hypothetical protein
MKLVIIGLLNIFLLIQVYAASGPTEKKASEIIETLKSSGQLNGKALSNALKPYIKDPATLKGISTLDTSKTSETDLKKGIVTFITIAENQKAGMCLKEEAKCGSESDLSCCAGLKCSDVTVPQNKMCNANGVLCKDNSSCCSGSCETNGKIKTCSSIRKCLRVLKEGDNCLPFQSICEIGFCGRVNTNSTNLDICARNRVACKSDTECCSKKCDNNLCVESFQCQNCKGVGQKVKGAEKCCEGYYPDLDGTCITDYPPSGPVTYSPKKKILQHIIDFIIPSAQAETETDLKDKKIISSTEEAKVQAAAELAAKTELEIQDSSQMVSNQYADFKTCNYLSKKLYYRQLSDSRKAAFDWSRAFEFMASGDGVKDYWSKNGSSIFDRAKIAAEEIKSNRVKSEKSLAEMDDFMTCTCLSMKWIDDPLITEAKKTFFKTTPCAGLTMKSSATSGAQLDPGAADLDSGTSGLKYQLLLTEYFAKTAEIHAQLLVQNTGSLDKLTALWAYLVKMDWSGKATITRYWSKSRDVWAWEFLLDIIISIEGAVYGFIEWGISNIFGNNSQTIWNGVADLWQRNPNKSQCHQVDSDIHFGYVTYEFDCSNEEFAPNPVCGKKIYNALCIKVAAARSDSGPLSANKFLVDPLIPKSMTFTLDSGFITNFDQNVNIKNVSYVPPVFSDVKKTELVSLAKQYAIDQDFYENDSQRDAFASYVFDKHFIYPYSNKEAVYPAPGLIPYYENGVHQMAIISSTYLASTTKDLERAELYSNLYLTTLDQYSDYRASVSPGRVAKIKATSVRANFQLGSIRNLTSSNSTGANPNSFNDSFFSKADAFSGVGDAQNAVGKHNKDQKAKLDNWNKYVGTTAKGKKLSEMKDLGNLGASGNRGGASSGASSNSASGNFKKSFLDSEASDLGKAATTGSDSGAKATAGSGAGNNGAGMTSVYGAASGSGDSAGTGSGATADATGLSAEEQQAMLDSANRDKNKLKPNEYDSLFGIIHKAYGRNLIHLFGSKKEIE